MKKFFSEFKAFIMRGNVVDLAVTPEAMDSINPLPNPERSGNFKSLISTEHKSVMAFVNVPTPLVSISFKPFIRFLRRFADVIMDDIASVSRPDV